MKSIVEEASSIFKAIEKAWDRAGKPADFSVKIFENPQTSFFGLTTTKQAKIGLFFADQQVSFANIAEEKKYKKTVPVAPRKPMPDHTYQKKSYQHEQPTPHKTAERIPQDREQMKKSAPEWSDDMLATTREWITSIIQKSNLPTAQYTIEKRGNRLQINFERPLLDDAAKNTQLFRGLSYILLGMIRSHYKKEFRFLKVVLTTPSQQDESVPF